MALLSIGGMDMPAPGEYEVSLQDIDSENTRRTETVLLLFRPPLKGANCRLIRSAKFNGAGFCSPFAPVLLPFAFLKRPALAKSNKANTGGRISNKANANRVNRDTEKFNTPLLSNNQATQV